MTTIDEHLANGLHERVIGHIFDSGSTLAGVLSSQRVDDKVAEQLRDAINALDEAVAELRSAAPVHVDAQREVRVIGLPTLPERPHSATADQGRCLHHFVGNDVFAYAVGGHDFHRAADHRLWAHESDGLLLSARFGTPLARRVGNVFYEIESNIPLYCETDTQDPVHA